MTSLISNVSDTARWIAAVRASESSRPDSVFQDPLAERLAGNRGAAISARLSWFARALTEGGIIGRTLVMDKLVLQAIHDGCQRVVNFGAGFDTRPYRLELPSRLTWIEVDLQAIMAEKRKLTERDVPRCRLERLAVDLADPQARADLMARLAKDSVPTLLISEGLLAYLTVDDVSSFATDLSQTGARWWITDVYSKQAMRTLRLAMGRHLKRSPVSFYAPADGLKFFFRHGGWQPHEVESELQTAKRIGRLPLPLFWLARAIGQSPRHSGRGNWIAIARFKRGPVTE